MSGIRVLLVREVGEIDAGYLVVGDVAVRRHVGRVPAKAIVGGYNTMSYRIACRTNAKMRT